MLGQLFLHDGFHDFRSEVHDENRSENSAVEIKHGVNLLSLLERFGVELVERLVLQGQISKDGGTFGHGSAVDSEDWNLSSWVESKDLRRFVFPFGKSDCLNGVLDISSPQERLNCAARL